MESLLQYLKTEWSVISAAPLTFAILAALIYGVVFLQFRTRLSSVKELLGIRNEQLADIQNRTGADSPEEIGDRLTAIERDFKEFSETDFLGSVQKILK